MKLEEIKELMKAMEANDISSFEYNEGEVHLSLRRGPQEVQVLSAPAPQAAAPAAPAAAQAAPAQAAQEEAPAKQPEAAPETGNVITSPLVGTFYAASAPDKDPYVKVGDHVKKGQVLGIIEAMKLMNEIESDYDGVVEAILVNNEEVVEYGQPLFRIG